MKLAILTAAAVTLVGCNDPSRTDNGPQAATSATNTTMTPPAISAPAATMPAVTAPMRSTNPNADNSAMNAPDASGSGLTAGDQGGSEADRKITQQVRQALMGDSSLSMSAKNVKIITVNGKVTLKGPVKSDQERLAIVNAAKKIAGASQVDNQLEIKQ